MGSSIGALLVTISASLGQISGGIDQEEREFQEKVYQQWWGNEIEWKFDELPAEGKVPEKRVPYSGYIYPDTAGGTMTALRKYDMAFHRGQSLATSHEKRDTSMTEVTTRQVTERVGFFGSQFRTYTVRTNSTPAWYGHCNGWTSAAIRHAEPEKEVTRNGVVFTPADIKGLLAEAYMYNDPQMLAGDGTRINPGVLHVVLANWIGNGKHPIGMEADPGKEKWNYPVYGYKMQTNRHSSEFVEVGMNITYAQSSRGEFQQSPRIPSYKYFHYRLQLDDQGKIVGGSYYGDSSQIDMLWAPLRLKPSGKEGNERGNPHLDVNEVLAIWRESVSDDVRRKWVIVDPPNRAPRITVAKSLEVPENQTHVVQVTAQDEDLVDSLSFVAEQQLSFSITGGPDGDGFAIDSESGELTFTEPPDFEQPNDANADNVYQLKVNVDDGAGESASQLLSIRVTDANDPPVITSRDESQVRENQLAVMTIGYEDQDQSEKSLICSLSGGPDLKHFAIDAESGKLTFKRAPDFEQPADADKDNVYEVNVAVKDTAGETASQLIRVAVTNDNDLPVITSRDKQQVAENQLAVTTIERSDEDSPKQALKCSLSGGADQKLFSVDSESGKLAFTSAPDFEHPADADHDNNYEVEVSVSDGAGGIAKQLVNVSITNINDAPMITSTKEPSVRENQRAVLKVAYKDEDLPKQEVTCSLIGGDDLAMFNINKATGELNFKNVPDFEHPADTGGDNVYEVALLVTDSAGGASAQLLNIRVTDANDAPVIISKPTFTVAERQASLFTISAKDEDSTGKQLQYSLAKGADRSKFTIDSKTGKLAFKRLPDFEAPNDKNKDNHYEVEVKVSDDEGAAATQLLSIAVTDANDSPVITTSDTATITEGELAVMTIEAKDEDVQPQTLAFSLQGGADKNRFALNAETGELTFKQEPNFEEPSDADGDNTYEVKVRVDDGAGGRASQTLQIAVADSNDAPIITSPNKVKAAENQLAVFTVSLADEDVPAQKLVCSLVGGSDRDRFTINPTTGELAFTQIVDFEKPTDANHDNIYEAELKVEDSQGGSTTQLLNVAIVNVNERPMITYTPKVPENQTEVLTVNVTDEDMSMQEDTTISLSDGADRKLFTIDAKTGDLAFKTAPDFEAPADADKDNIYEVVVQVDDGHGGLATQRIRVKVTDVHETPVVAVEAESSGSDVEVTATTNGD